MPSQSLSELNSFNISHLHLPATSSLAKDTSGVLSPSFPLSMHVLLTSFNTIYSFSLHQHTTYFACHPLFFHRHHIILLLANSNHLISALSYTLPTNLSPYLHSLSSSPSILLIGGQYTFVIIILHPCIHLSLTLHPRGFYPFILYFFKWYICYDGM